MKHLLAILAGLSLASPAMAQDVNTFRTGPIFQTFGPHAPVEATTNVPADTEFAVAFDAVDPGEDGKPNRTFESAARFINMHVAAGVDPDDIRIAIVVHGKASLDLMRDRAWAVRNMGKVNPSGAMLREMLDHGVRFILCGQSGAANGIAQADLMPGVETALSAMTAHALLQQGGYTLNPF